MTAAADSGPRLCGIFSSRMSCCWALPKDRVPRLAQMAHHERLGAPNGEAPAEPAYRHANQCCHALKGVAAKACKARVPRAFRRWHTVRVPRTPSGEAPRNAGLARLTCHAFQGVARFTGSPDPASPAPTRPFPHMLFLGVALPQPAESGRLGGQRSAGPRRSRGGTRLALD